MEKFRCQSCGQPLGEFSDPKTGQLVHNFGTEADGSRSTEWCHLCYEKGDFREPNLTLDDMFKISIDHMVIELNIPEEQAIRLANDTIPQLKRWQE